MRVSKRKPFDNCRALAPDGTFLFHCTRRKAEAYIKHASAEVVTEDPFVFRLLFDPAGPGTSADPCLSRPLENRCVVCGSEDRLTKHHIVPYCYRRWMDVGYLTNYDVVAICVPCHDRYEVKARALKRQIEREVGVPESCYHRRRTTPLDEEFPKLRSHANALLRYLPVLPSQKIAACLETLRSYYGRPNITRDDLTALCYERKQKKKDREFITPSRYVVGTLECLADCDSFAVRWRVHFLMKMKPKFMPRAWHPYRNVNGSFGRKDRGVKRTAKCTHKTECPQPDTQQRNILLP